MPCAGSHKGNPVGLCALRCYVMSNNECKMHDAHVAHCAHACYTSFHFYVFYIRNNDATTDAHTQNARALACTRGDRGT